jgi:hypothetical protein
MDKLKELKLYTDSKGRVLDGEGMEFFLPKKEAAAENTNQFKTDGGLDMVNDITLTGNLTVQQSQWVYLRGPITSSGILINGSMTGSNLWIRDRSGGAEHPMEGMGYGIFDKDVIIGGESVKESIDTIGRLEKSASEWNGMSGKLDWIEGKVKGIEEGVGDRKDIPIQLQSLKSRIDRIDKSVGEIEWLGKKIEDLGRDKGGGDREIEIIALRGRVDRIEAELGEVSKIVKELSNDLGIIMKTLYK